MVTGTMTTGTFSNYGSTFTKGGSSIGPCIVVDFPEISTEKKEMTNHASGGVREYIPSGLVGVGDITLSVLAQGNNIASMYSEMAAETVSECIVANPSDTMTFQGFYTSIKEEAADAQNPDLVKLTVVIACAGFINFS